jgi:secondary thiamine-phosphate synthase enzyme
VKIIQQHISLTAKPRGFHLVTREIEKALDIGDIRTGIIHLFLQHSSASLSINENWDPSVRDDMESFFNEVVSENKSYFTHTYEGKDDMPAHLKSVLLGVSVSIPLANGTFDLGTWQGIYLNEHRDHGSRRHIVATIIGE